MFTAVSIKALWDRVWVRLIPALGLYAISLWLMSRSLTKSEMAGSALVTVPYMLFGTALIALAAVILAPAISRAMVERVADFLTYSEKYDRPQPMYGKAMALRKNLQFEQAMAVYEEITEDHPREIKPYLEMIDIALHDLKDPDRAEHIHQRGMQSLKDEQQLKRLAGHGITLAPATTDNEKHQGGL